MFLTMLITTLQFLSIKLFDQLLFYLLSSSPMTIGAGWAIDRQFFKDIGEFDEGMELWGGENIDLPLRVSS